MSIEERWRLDGRRALVTGAGQGIGRAFAHALGEAGARVAVIDRDATRAEEVAAELAAKGIESVGIAADVTAEGAAAEYVGTVLERWGGLEIAVNNAGINRNAAAEDTTPEEWDEVFDLNLRAVFLGCQEEARAMLDAGYGKIVNTASMASMVVPHPQKQVAYNAAKAGVVQLSRTLAAEWADRSTAERARFVDFLERVVVKQKISRHPDVFRKASPIARVHKDAPPFLVIHGTCDSVIPVEQARSFVERLRAASHSVVSYVELPGAGHAFDMVDGARTGSMATAIGLFLNQIHRNRTPVRATEVI